MRRFKVIVEDADTGVVEFSAVSSSYAVAVEDPVTGQIVGVHHVAPALIAQAMLSKGQGIVGSVLAGIKRVGNGSSSFAP